MHNRISEVQITPIKARDGLVGFASIVFDNCLYLGSIGIFTRPNGGYRLTFPTRTNGTQSINVFHPINRDIADSIERAISEKFQELVEQ